MEGVGGGSGWRGWVEGVGGGKGGGGSGWRDKKGAIGDRMDAE